MSVSPTKALLDQIFEADPEWSVLRAHMRKERAAAGNTEDVDSSLGITAAEKRRKLATTGAAIKRAMDSDDPRAEAELIRRRRTERRPY